MVGWIGPVIVGTGPRVAGSVRERVPRCVPGRVELSRFCTPRGFPTGIVSQQRSHHFLLELARRDISPYVRRNHPANTRQVMTLFVSGFILYRRCHRPKRVRCYPWRAALDATRSLRVPRTARYACGTCATSAWWRRPRIVRRVPSAAAVPCSCAGWGKRPW